VHVAFITSPTADAVTGRVFFSAMRAVTCRQDCWHTTRLHGVRRSLRLQISHLKCVQVRLTHRPLLTLSMGIATSCTQVATCRRTVGP
jgi:hypothetical protein